MSPDSPRPGSRVVMRYRLPEGYPVRLTDIIGELISEDPPTVRNADGAVVSVSADRVVALKALAPRLVRTGEIRALESAAAAGWPGIESEWVDGWLLRAGGGYTWRANSAVPLGAANDPGAVGGFATTATRTIDRIRRWYADRGLLPMLVVPDRLVPVPPGWSTFGGTLVLVVDLDRVVFPNRPSMVVVESAPGPGWLELLRRYDSRADTIALAMRVLSAERGGLLGFASLGVEHVDALPVSPPAALPMAIARGAVTDALDGRRWVGLSMVKVAASHRRHGLGTLICAEMLRWGQSLGATHGYVQVDDGNTAAIEMYRALKFADHHRYRYAIPPDE